MRSRESWRTSLRRPSARRRSASSFLGSATLLMVAPAVVMSASLPAKIYKIAYHGHIQGVAGWLDAGGKVDARGSGHESTLLMVASFRGHVQLVRLLLERGADIELRNRMGLTAMKLVDHCADHTAAASIHSMLLQQSQAPVGDGTAGAPVASSQAGVVTSSPVSPRTTGKVTPREDPSASSRQRRLSSGSPADSSRVTPQPQGSIQRTGGRGRGGRADGGRGGRVRAR